MKPRAVEFIPREVTMPSIENAVHIPAPRDLVWRVLVETARYREWNPRLVRVDGALASDAVITLHYTQEHRFMPKRYVVTVSAFAPEQELAWSGPNNAARALLRAVHFFRLHAADDGTRLVHGEIFSGALAPVIWPVLGPIVARNHGAVNDALRRRCAELGESRQAIG